MKIKNFFAILAFAVAIAPIQDALGLDCSHGATTSAKGNDLFLYFPTASDATFVSTISGQSTSPLAAFEVADLTTGIGTTTQLRDRIFEYVAEDYCEFNVKVIKTTTAPVTTGILRWQIVGIGSDSNGGLVGISSLGSNTGDADAQDYTRVWAGGFADAYGGTGGVLNGTNSTRDRWSAMIGSTTSHEAAHNYGVTHCEAGDLAGEDAPPNHIMNTGNVTGQGCAYTETVDGEDRATRRHFSDQSYELLAYNVGLNIMTVYNWDFINPNAEDAHSLEITLLSTADALTISTWWNGTRSPWRDPTITKLTGLAGTQEFQETDYNVFILDFSTDKSWVGGADGVLPGGAEFHIGAGFSESDLVIVHDTKLKDSSSTPLTLHPRMAGFSRGAADLLNGDFVMAMYNPDPDAGDMIIRDLKIQYLPRLVDINAMLVGEKMRDVRGAPIIAHGSCDPRGCNTRKDFDLKQSKEFHLGKLSDDRFVDIIHDSTNCIPGLVSAPADSLTDSFIYCPEGNSLSLFPSTSVYVTATIIDPNARYFDRNAGSYVNGPLESKVFYQFVGIAPDFNKNGIDDLLDIRAGTSIDANGNGVVDEAEPKQTPDNGDKPPELPWWVYLIFVILVIAILLLYSRQRKAG